MAGGRPTKYTEDLLVIAREYPENYKDYNHSFPSVVGLCRIIGIHSETAYAWARDPEKEEFSGIIKHIMDNQHFDLIEGGLNGEFNPTITKLILAKHGHSEKQEIKQETTATVEHKVSHTEKLADILKDYDG
jgi:hypothetical protein